MNALLNSMFARAGLPHQYSLGAALKVQLAVRLWLAMQDDGIILPYTEDAADLAATAIIDYHDALSDRTMALVDAVTQDWGAEDYIAHA